MTKYGFKIPSKTFNEHVYYLTGQIWKLIPMRENNEDWLKQLNNVINKIAGLNEIFSYDQRFLDLLSTLEGIKVSEEIVEFEFYRNKVFECINLLQELKENVER